jgi:hypothetical protein
MFNKVSGFRVLVHLICPELTNSATVKSMVVQHGAVDAIIQFVSVVVHMPFGHVNNIGITCPRILGALLTNHPDNGPQGA